LPYFYVFWLSVLLLQRHIYISQQPYSFMNKLCLILFAMLFFIPVAFAQATCTVTMTATDTASFFAEIPSLNTQLQACPQQLPSGTGLLIPNGNNVVDVSMNSGQTQSFTVVVSNRMITGITASALTPCKQTAAITENDFDTALSGTNRFVAIANLFLQRQLTLTGCGFFSSFRLFFVQPIARLTLSGQVPSTPAVAPTTTTTTPSNCGAISEQCNNRGCTSGICAAPPEDVNGQTRFVNYRCIDQQQWEGNCRASGNSPAPWDCITGPCS
jgi:hypothetical protein